MRVEVAGVDGKRLRVVVIDVMAESCVSSRYSLVGVVSRVALDRRERDIKENIE